MTYDLRRELATMGAQELAAAAPLPTDELRRQAGRRRAARTAGVSGLAVVAVAAVAIAAVALPTRSAAPQPANSPTATPSSTPTPSSTQTAEPTLPTAVTLAHPATCGDPLPPVLQPDGAPELTLSATVPPTLTTDDRLVVDYALTIAEIAVPTLSVDRPALALVSGGVVVAYGTTPESATTDPQAELDLLACDTGERLGAGSYDVYLVQPLHPIVGGTVTDETLLVTAGPYPLTLEEPFDPHPALTDLVVSTAGLGPLAVGLPAETNPGAAMIEFDPDYCAEQNGGEWDPSLGPVGEWVVAGYEPSRGWMGDGLRQPFGVAVVDGIVAQIALASPELRTAEGVGLGSTREALLAAYPDLVEVTTEADLSQVWQLRGETGDLIFETGDVDYTAETTDDVVVGITIAARGYGQATFWGSGAFPGNCGVS